ncbi:hypothetical protein [Nocardia noduli]|uniref:hypothetical protein n=1 Tax=Nocardia noduli TaxID=2815722 RepID=UPI001C24986C|nr:hypothetical protein [Nocardia noduli]
MYRTLVTVIACGALTALASGIAQAEPASRLREGMQVVGQDVVSGTYSTSGPRADDYGACFIEWLPYKGARSSELIDIQSYTGASYVRLHDGDVINVTGCVWIHE